MSRVPMYPHCQKETRRQKLVNRLNSILYDENGHRIEADRKDLWYCLECHKSFEVERKRQVKLKQENDQGNEYHRLSHRRRHNSQ